MPTSLKLSALLALILFSTFCSSQSGSGFGGSGINFNNPLVISFPFANATNQTQNNVAGCNSNIPVAQCQGGSTSNTTAAGVINATTYTSGSSVTFTETNGVNTDTMRYICVGF